MSSQAYVYIPNLVGRQMLRVEVMPCEESDYTEEPQLSTEKQSHSYNTTTCTATVASRDQSRSPSVSVESVDELE